MNSRKHSRALSTFGWLLLAFVSLGGCNLITGVHKLDVESATPEDENGGQGGGNGDGDGDTGGRGEGGSGGSSRGGTSPGGASSGGAPGTGGEIPTDCDESGDCVHPDACLLGQCASGTCTFVRMTCDSDKTCEEGECVCPEGEVDCGSGCEEGICCPGETNGGCGRCGVRTCSADQSEFECTGQGECTPGETCGGLLDSRWEDGEMCGCGVAQEATCSDTCEKGPCE